MPFTPQEQQTETMLAVVDGVFLPILIYRYLWHE